MNKYTPEQQAAALKKHDAYISYNSTPQKISESVNDLYNTLCNTICGLSEQLDALCSQVKFISASFPKFQEKLKGNKLKMSGYAYHPVPVTLYSIKDESAYTTPEAAREDIQRVLNENAPLIQEYNQAVNHNIRSFETVKRMLILMGLPTEEWRIPSGKRKTIKMEAAWIGTLKQAFASKYPMTTFTNDFGKSHLEAVANWEKALAAQKEAEAELQRTQEKAEKEIERKIMLNKKYNLGFDGVFSVSATEFNEVLLEKLLSINKYLTLAYWLYRNRCDWTDGPDYAEVGLNSFKVENVRDQAIYDDIQSYITNWDGDGRIFRDCDYNYKTLASMTIEENPDLQEVWDELISFGSQ